MKRIVFGMLLFAICGIAQAGALVIDNASNISFSAYDGEPAGITGVQSSGWWGALRATSAGIFTVTYLGNESGFVNSYHFGAGSGALLESNHLGDSISQSVDAGIVSFSFSDNDGSGHTFWNGDQQSIPFGFAILAGQANIYGEFDYLLGFNDSWAGDADYDDFVVGVNFTSQAPVPEPQNYAMFLAGLGLLGVSMRRRKNSVFD